MMTATEAQQTVKRFERILDSLRISSWPTSERRWLEFGAVAALQCLCAPGAVAERLRMNAIELGSADGGTGLRSGVRFQIAGALTHTGMPVEDFAVQLRRLRDLLRAASVVSCAGVEAATVAIMMLRSTRARLSVPEVTRVVETFRHLREHQWWQREIADAPLAAMLTTGEGTGDAHGYRLDAMRQELGSITGVTGPALTAAAGILAAHLQTDGLTERFAGLFRASGSDPRHGLLPALALWSELPLEPMVIIDAFDTVSQMTRALVPFDDAPSADFICGAIAYLTLSRDACGTAETAADPQRNPLRRFHAACVLSGIDLLNA